MIKGKVFTRDATGLRRDWKTADAFMFNLLTMGILSGAAYTVGTAPATFPGGNLVLGILLTAAFGTFMWTTYVLLSVSLPRSGADWVFQSRILVPSLAAAIVIGDIFYLIYWVVFGTFYAAVGGIGPFFTLIGTSYGNPALASFGTWVGSGAGWSFFIIGLVLLFFAGWQLILPIRMYARVQWFLMGSVLAGILVVLIAFASTSQSVFIADFNKFATQWVPNDPDYYHTVIKQAAQAGTNVRGSFSWYDQVGIFPVAWSLLAWAFWSAQFNGEIKGASVVKTQNIIMNGSGWFCAAIWVLFAFFLINMAGLQFVIAAGTLTFSGGFAIPLGAYLTTYVAALGGTNLGPLLIVALFIIMLAFVMNGYQIFYNTIGGPIRMGFMMAFDRMLPDAFAKVSDRWASPVNFTLLALIIAAAQLWAAAFYPTVAPLIIPASLSSGAIPYAFTCLAGALLPYRQKDVYQQSPAAKYKVGSVPLVTITGIIGMLFNIVIIYYWFTVPALGLTNYAVLVFIVGAYIVGAVWYFGYKAYRKRQGVDVTLAFKVIPPE
jgi:amino acid transporter